MQRPFFLFCLFLILTVNQLNAQEISGIVLDGNTNEPLESASVYFDNTTIGTTTNSAGEFTITYNDQIKSTLVISFLGYKTQRLDEFDLDEPMTIYLFEDLESLDEVVIIADDGWPRDLKLKEFKKHYLGESLNGKSCRIINEDDLILRYDKRRKRLTVTSKGPIIIRNRNLKYEILVELDKFEANYSYVSKNLKRLSINYVYYAGANFYKSLQEEPSKNTLAKRKKAYEGSVLHFMRALSQESLKEEGYRVFLGNSEVSPRRYISVFPIENSNAVNVKLKDRLNIVYDGTRQSSVESYVDKFHIDHFGNHSPPEEVRFGGDLGAQRMGDTLPLDFLLLSQKNTKGL